ncbi:hypothetical protein [Halobacillus seohaensis]
MKEIAEYRVCHDLTTEEIESLKQLMNELNRTVDFLKKQLHTYHVH